MPVVPHHNTHSIKEPIIVKRPSASKVLAEMRDFHARKGATCQQLAHLFDSSYETMFEALSRLEAMGKVYAEPHEKYGACMIWYPVVKVPVGDTCE